MKDQRIQYTAVSPQEIERMAAAGEAILLDVREQDEWDAGHLKHARFLSLSSIQEITTPEQTGLPPGVTIYSHCKAGVRSVYAAGFLRKLGIDCHPLQHGFEDLVAVGLETS